MMGMGIGMETGMRIDMGIEMEMGIGMGMGMEMAMRMAMTTPGPFPGCLGKSPSLLPAGTALGEPLYLPCPVPHDQDIRREVPCG